MAANQIPDFDDAVLDLIDQQGYQALAPASVDAPTPGRDPLPAAQAYIVDGDARITEGQVVIDVCFYATTYVAARELLKSFDAVLMGYPVKVSSNGRTVLFDSVETISIPKEVPWLDDSSVRKFMATYRVSFRR